MLRALSDKKILVVQVNDLATVYPLDDETFFKVRFEKEGDIYSQEKLQYESDGDIILELKSVLPKVEMPVEPEKKVVVDYVSLAGVWSGEYTCAQGKTSLNLEISVDDEKNLRGIFTFFAHPDNPGVPSGSYEMAGKYDPLTGRILLEGTNWIDRPGEFTMVSLNGEVHSDNTISGAVISIQRTCKTFFVAKNE